MKKIIFMILLSVSSANAGPVSFGISISAFNPWPGIIGAGGGVRFFDFLHLGASIAPLEWLVGAMSENSDFIWGANVQLIPHLGVVSPLVGLSYNQRILDAPTSAFYGYRKGVFTYLNPMVGAEFSFFPFVRYSVGLFYMLEKDSKTGKFVREPDNSTGFLGKTGIMFFVSMSILFGV